MKKLIIRSAIIAALLLTGISSCKVVPAGHTGVVTRMGAVSDNVLSEGIHFTAPFVTKVKKIDNRVVRTDVDIHSASKDLQIVTGTVSVNYRVNAGKSASIFKNIGKDYEDVIIRPAVQESTKAVMARFNAEELTTERLMVGEQMRDALSEKIKEYGIDVEALNIINFDFTEEFNKAIEAKQTAQQNALKAEQDLARIKIEAEQKIEQAKAEAETYRLQNQEVTDKTLALKYLEKWDGKLPTVTSDGQNIFDLNSILGR